ncbi:MAG: hydrolase [Pseudomonadota bacterium]|jgi:nicotinamidase-related amidase|nr:hydrolase [Pseudomonadota bacterium]
MTNPSSLCEASDSALIVIDIQPILTTAMPDDDAQQMLANAESLLQACDALQIPVLMTEQYPKGLGETEPSLLDKLPSSAERFDKTGFSCCAAEGFMESLEQTGRKQVVLVGQEAHVCVLQTAVELTQAGYAVFVAEDSVCSRKQEHRFFALERMREADVTISNYESVLFEWLRDSRHPNFKELSQLIR